MDRQDVSTVFQFPGDPTVGISSNFYTRFTTDRGNSCSNFRKIQRCKQKLFTSVWTVQRLFLSLKIRGLRLFLDFPEIQRSESAQIFTRGSPLIWETPIEISGKSDGANRRNSLLFGLSINIGNRKSDLCSVLCLVLCKPLKIRFLCVRRGLNLIMQRRHDEIGVCRT